MAISRSPSIASVIVHPPKPVSGIRGFIENIFEPRITHRTEESQPAQQETTSQLSQASLPDASHVHEASTSTYPPPSQEMQNSQTLPQESHLETQQPPKEPPFIARDFAYHPAPEILPYTVDEKWVVRINVPKNPVPGVRERLADQWEENNIHLYRLRGNRADPPHTIPKTWGGRSKSEDRALKHQAEQRALLVERMKQSAAALGLTPTEPNIGGPPPVEALQVDFDREAAARADAYKKQREAEALAAGYGPLIKTPTNSPPPERRPRGFPLPPPPPPPLLPPTTPLPHSSPSKGSKRKLDASDSECDVLEPKPTGRGRVRKRQQRKPDPGTVDEPADEPGPSTSRRYFLRQRHPDGTNSGTPSPTSSTKRKGKNKGKASEQ